LWYTETVTSDESVINDIEVTLGNAFGVLLNRGRLGLNPVTFAFDRVCQGISRSLNVYKHARVAVLHKTGRRVRINDFEGSILFKRGVAQEFRTCNRLHPMFYLAVEWDPRMGGHFKGGDPQTLSEEDFFHPERIKACETKYCQFVSSHLTKLLLVDADDVNNKLLRHLVTELFGNAVLRPVYMLFTPLTVMGWIKMGLSWGAQVPQSAATGSSSGTSQPSSSDSTAGASADLNSDATTIHDTLVRPPGFPEDAAWTNYRRGIGEREAAELLKSEPDGAYVIISLNGKELFSVVSIYSTANASYGDGPMATGKPLSALLGTRRLYHIPFVGYTTSPAGFQICIISSDEYFPLSDPPPEAVAILNGSMYPSLRQLLNAAYCIKGNYVLPAAIKSSMTPSDNNNMNEIDEVNLTTSNRKKGLRDDAAEEYCNEFLDGGKLSDGDSDDDSSMSDEVKGDSSTGTDGESDETMELFVQQERLVFIFELQGAIDEFKDVVQHIRSHRASKVVAPLSILGDPAAMKALRRLLLCLEDVLLHGFKVRPEDAIQALKQSRQVRYSSNDVGGGAVEADVSKKYDVELKPKPGTLSTLFKAMSSKIDLMENKGACAVSRDSSNSNVKPDPRATHSGEYNDDLIRFLESRFCAQWFWMESYRYNSDSSAGQTSNISGPSTSDTDKLQTSSKRISAANKRDDALTVLHRLSSAWLDLGSRGIMMSLDDCFDILETCGVDETHLYSLNKPLDRNCLRAFLYDSLIHGVLLEKIKRIAKIATSEVVVDDKKACQELVFGHLFTTHIARGSWGNHAILMNSGDRKKLFDVMASIDDIALVPPDDNSKNVFDGVFKSIRSANSVFPSSSVTETNSHVVSAAKSERGNGDFGMSTLDALYLSALNKKSSNHELTTRLRARRASAEEAWAAQKTEYESSGTLDSLMSFDPKRILQLRKKSVRNIDASESDRNSDDTYESRLRALSGTSTQIAGSPGKSKGIAWEPSNLSSSPTDGDGALTKPPPLVKRMSEPSNLSLARRRESSFKLEMLLNGRPTLSTLMNANIWEPAAYKLTADMKRIELDEDKGKLNITISGGPQVVIYQLWVSSDRLYPDPTDLTADGKIRDIETTTWIVRKRYSDFSDLHKQLKTNVGLKVLNYLQLPQKQFINVGNMGGSNFQFVEKRRQGLQEYLDNLLLHLPYCKEVRAFLTRPMEERLGKASLLEPPEEEEPARKRSDSNENAASLSSKLVDRPISALMDAIKLKKFAKEKDAPMGGSSVSSKPPKTAPGAVLTQEEGKTEDNRGSEPGDKASAENSRGVASASLDSRTMRILEVRVYDLLREVLDFDTMSVVRRKLVSIVHTSITVLFSGTLKEWASAQAKGAVSDASIVWLLEWVVGLVWPNGVLLTRVPNRQLQPTDPMVVEEELLKLHTSNLNNILAKLPASLLSNSLGDGQAEKAVALLLNLLENPYVLKNLMYILFDLLFMEMFPEMRPFLSGMEVLR
jgi:hypothetical protein